MGKRGPKPKPTALRVFEGTRLQYPTDRSGEPVPTASDIPEMPSWIGPYGEAEWSRMVPILASIGCFTDSDWTIFAQYCGCIDRFHEARENVKVNGMTFETETGTKANPAVKIMQTSTDQIVRIGNMFGMSPSARVGLVGVPTDAARDDLERFKAEVG